MDIISRAEWGARAPIRRSTVSWAGLDTLWVHHTAGPSSQTPAQIQAFHMGPQRMWNDVGYGYLIDKDGRVYEGRGREVLAAHCPGHNHEPSVALIGDYSALAPPEIMRQRVWELADHLGLSELNGHRDGFSTSCPGDAAYRSVVQAPRPERAPDEPAPQPTGQLRVAVRVKGQSEGRAYADEAGWHALEWFRENGIRDTTDVALAFKGGGWRTGNFGPRAFRMVTRQEMLQVIRTLLNNQFEGV